jgi:hypothetical protein
MTGRSVSNILSNEEQSLDEVWAWYEFQRALIGEEKVRVLGLLDRGETPVKPRYLFKTREEIDHDFAYQTAELGWLAMLGMMGSMEAALRVDFIERVSNRKKDEVSRKFRRIANRRDIGRIRLEEDILDTWRDFGSHDRIKSAVAEFKGTLNLRHWLAHGRYWKPKLGRAAGYDPVDILDVCKELLQVVGLMEFNTPQL